MVSDLKFCEVFLMWFKLIALLALIGQSVYGSELHDVAIIGDVVRAQNLIMKEGVNVNATDDVGRIPLHYSAKHGSVQIASLLLKKRANVNAIDELFGRTPLHYAVVYDRILLAELFLKQGADMNIKDNFGYTPRDFAVENNLMDMVLLLENAVEAEKNSFFKRIKDKCRAVFKKVKG